MKKLLITSSALVAAAGMAQADGHTGVSLSGSAEMGIASVDGGTTGATDGNTYFHSAFDVTFSLSGETDNGLSFGASFDLDETDDGNSESGSSSPGNPFGAGVGDQSVDGSVFVSGAFGTLTMGDTDGAFDWALTETASGTAIADDHTSHDGYNGNGLADGINTLRYDNTFGDFGVAVSLGNLGGETLTTSITGDTNAGITVSGTSDDTIVQVGLKYAVDLGGTTLGLGLGYVDAGIWDAVGLSATAGFGAASVTANYSQIDGDGGIEVEHMGLGFSYTMDALSFHVNWGEYDYDADVTDGSSTKVDGWGANVNYDLGGGAVLALGYGSDDADDRYSLGLRMDF